MYSDMKGCFIRVCNYIPLIFTWWITVWHLRSGPRWTGWENSLLTDVERRACYILWWTIRNIFTFPKISQRGAVCITLSNVTCQTSVKACLATMQPIIIAQHSRNRSVLREQYCMFLTFSWIWPGMGKSFSLETASARCSALLGEGSMSRLRACPWGLVRTRLLLQRLPIGGVWSWKEEGKSWGTCWWWRWCCSWTGSCQLWCFKDKQ